MPQPIISFQNPGEIDPRLVTTLGVNVKTGDSPIGFFGTGLKYAIAVLLRNGHDIRIWSGTRQYTFHVRPEIIRDKPFNMIMMHEQSESGQINITPLGFTTDLGRRWTLREAYRELYCNCIDEGGSGGIETRLRPVSGSTLIEISGDGFANVHTIRHEIILSSDLIKLHSANGLEVYQGRTKSLFYRGIKVYDFPVEAAFTYNITTGVALTEDRTLASIYYFETILREYITRHARKPIINDTVCVDGTWEHSHLGFFGAEPGENFMEALRVAIKEKPQSVSPQALNLYYKSTKPKDATEYDLYAPTEREQNTLQRSITFCEKAGFPLSKYTIKTAVSLGQNIIGRAENSTIWLAMRALADYDVCRSTLIEEYMHLEYGVPDESRAFQEALIYQIIRLGEALPENPK